MAPANSYIRNCCGMHFPLPSRPNDVEARMHQPSGLPTRCGKCREHQGDDVDTHLARADDHTQLYWEWYQKANAAAVQMAARVKEAEAAVGEFRDRMKSAYQSRDAATRVLASVARRHEPLGQGCSCKRPNCETGEIVNRRWTQERIRQLVQREGNVEYGDPDNDRATS